MSLFWIYAFCRRKKQTLLLQARQNTYTHMQITLHLVDFTGDKNVAFDFSDACFFGYPVDSDYQDFLKFARDFSFQHFNAEKLQEML